MRCRAFARASALATTVVCVLLLGIASTVEAQYDIPRKAPLLNAFLVNAYDPCTIPNDTIRESNGVLVDACNPPIRSDPTCGLGPTGVGRVVLKEPRRATYGSTIGSMQAKFNLRGMEGCEGERLSFIIRVRTTTECTDGDAAQSCTSIVRDLNPLDCEVHDGRCGTGARFVQTDIVDTFIGANTEILDVFFERNGLRTLTLGVLLRPGTF